MACDVFILISGFYMINNNSISFKKSLSLIFEMYVYSVIGLIVLLVTNAQPCSMTEMIKTLFPVFFGNWFCVYYIIFFMFIPYVNKGLNSLAQSEYKKLVLLILLVWSIIPTFTGHAWKFGDFDSFIFMYIVGGYLGKYHIPSKNKTKNAKICLFSCISIYVLSVMGLDILGAILDKNILLEKAVYLRNISSPVSIACAISLFIVFKEYNFTSRRINTISSTVLGIYLLHDNAAVRNLIWNVWSPNATMISSNFLPLHFLIKTSTVFIICAFIDIARQYITKHIFSNAY